MAIFFESMIPDESRISVQHANWQVQLNANATKKEGARQGWSELIGVDRLSSSDTRLHQGQRQRRQEKRREASVIGEEASVVPSTELLRAEPLRAVGGSSPSSSRYRMGMWREQSGLWPSSLSRALSHLAQWKYATWSEWGHGVGKKEEAKERTRQSGREMVRLFHHEPSWLNHCEHSWAILVTLPITNDAASDSLGWWKIEVAVSISRFDDDVPLRRIYRFRFLIQFDWAQDAGELHAEASPEGDNRGWQKRRETARPPRLVI